MDSLPIATLEALPIELIWHIACFLLPQDWLYFMIAYERAYTCALNPILVSEYKSSYIEFYTKRYSHDCVDYYHRFKHNGKKHGSYMIIRGLEGAIYNYKNDKLHGNSLCYLQDIGDIMYAHYVDGELDGIFIYSNIDIKIPTSIRYYKNDEFIFGKNIGGK